MPLNKNMTLISIFTKLSIIQALTVCSNIPRSHFKLNKYKKPRKLCAKEMKNKNKEILY